MRSVIVIAAIASLATGVAFAQYDAKPGSAPAAKTEPATPQAGASTTSKAGAALTETQAKARIEAQGYSNVSELKKDTQGDWMAKAMKNGKSVDLSLDARGQIAAH